jgi:hypothetical protein
MHPTRRMFGLVLIQTIGAALALGREAFAADGVLITFTSGTGDAPGKITVTNAGNGSTTTVGLAPKLPAATCAEMLASAAPKVGVRSELAGSAVKIYSRSAIVKVDGATITKSDL